MSVLLLLLEQIKGFLLCERGPSSRVCERHVRVELLEHFFTRLLKKITVQHVAMISHHLGLGCTSF